MRPRQRDDLLLLYLSGHGIKDDQGELHFACIDTEFSLLSGTAVPAYFIRNLMERSNSKKQILILDCCYSGAVKRGAKTVVGYGAINKDTFNAGYGRIILTASDSVQYAFEGDNLTGEAESSIFTSALVAGLATGNADFNNDGLITVDDWYQYAFTQVKSSNYSQTPQMWADKLEGSFTIAFNSKAPKSNIKESYTGKPIVGTYEVQFQSDNSIGIPQPVREYLLDGFFVTQGFDRCLMVMREAYFREIYERINSTMLADPSARLLRRLILANAYPGEVGSDNSMFLPRNLLEFLGLDNNLIVCGQGEYIEIWIRKDWQIQLSIIEKEPSTETLHSLHVLLRGLIKQVGIEVELQKQQPK